MSDETLGYCESLGNRHEMELAGQSEEAKDGLVPDLDPRVVATKAAVRDARLPDRVFEPGVMSGHLTPVQRVVDHDVQR